MHMLSLKICYFNRNGYLKSFRTTVALSIVLTPVLPTSFIITRAHYGTAYARLSGMWYCRNTPAR